MILIYHFFKVEYTYFRGLLSLLNADIIWRWVDEQYESESERLKEELV